MVVRTSSGHGSQGDAPRRNRGGGDARLRSGTQEPCVYFLKRGKCGRGARCRFRHVDLPHKTGVGRNATRQSPNDPPGGKRPRKDAGAPRKCFYCGKEGHIKKDCRKRKTDEANTVVDFACPVDDQKRVSSLFNCLGLESQVTSDHDCALALLHQHSNSRWLVDGGATCHVAGFDPGSALENKRLTSVDIVVGGGRRIPCSWVGDLTIIVHSQDLAKPSRITLREVRVVPGFGSNLISGPRMERAGWTLTQGKGNFTATDGSGHVVFSVPADPRGLYYLNNVVFESASEPARGQRNFPNKVGSEKLSTSHFFDTIGDNRFQEQSLVHCSLSDAANRSGSQGGRSSSHVLFPSCEAERMNEETNSPSVTLLSIPGLWDLFFILLTRTRLVRFQLKSGRMSG